MIFTGAVCATAIAGTPAVKLTAAIAASHVFVISGFLHLKRRHAPTCLPRLLAACQKTGPAVVSSGPCSGQLLESNANLSRDHNARL
jgi:hypothetical protein